MTSIQVRAISTHLAC